MNYLENLRTFVTVVELGTLTQAAGQLYIAKSAVSRRLAELEGHLGVQLFHRTTRSMALTAEGQQFYHRSRAILDDVLEAETQVKSVRQQLRGKFRISVPLTFGVEHLTPALNDFMFLHPDIEFDLDFSEREVDIVEEAFDLVLRIGELDDSSLMARKLAPIQRVLCASPAYLQTHPLPQSPEELRQHCLLRYSLRPMHEMLVCTDPAGNLHRSDMPVKLSANNGTFLLQAAIAGHGMALFPTFIAYKALRTGELQAVLPEYSWGTAHLYAIYPPTRYLALRVRALIDFLQQRLADVPYWDKGIML